MKILDNIKNLLKKKKIESWLDKYEIENYTINDDFTVDVEGSVDLSIKNLELIPIQFGKVTGNFYCHHNKLTSLIGCPNIVCGNFHCGNNKLTSLEFCPNEIKGSFYCNNNNLTSLEGCPEFIGGIFDCEYNPIANIENFKCSFAGRFLHNSHNENEMIPLLEHLYDYDIGEDIYSLIINFSQLQNALLHHKLHTHISLKDNNLQKKNKL